MIPVVLLPGLEIVLERNASRSGNRRLGDEEVANIHGRMAGWYGSGLPIIDNSRQDIATAARMLDEVVARSLGEPPALVTGRAHCRGRRPPHGPARLPPAPARP